MIRKLEYNINSTNRMYQYGYKVSLILFSLLKKIMKNSLTNFFIIVKIKSGEAWRFSMTLTYE